MWYLYIFACLIPVSIQTGLLEQGDNTVADSVQSDQYRSLRIICTDVAWWINHHVSLQAVSAWRHSWRGQPYRSWRSLPGTCRRQPQQPKPLTNTVTPAGNRVPATPFVVDPTLMMQLTMQTSAEMTDAYVRDFGRCGEARLPLLSSYIVLVTLIVTMLCFICKLEFSNACYTPIV